MVEKLEYVNNLRDAYKIKLIGDPSAGKTSFHLCLKDELVPVDNLPTYGLEIVETVIEFEPHKAAYIKVWDTTGQERFRSLNRSLYLNVQGFFLMYDITDLSSFENMASYLQDIKENANKSCIVMIIGNFLEKEGCRQVLTKEGQLFAQTHGFEFMEISSKEQINIYECIKKMTQRLYQKFDNKYPIQKKEVKQHLEKKVNKKEKDKLSNNKKHLCSIAIL